VQGTKEERKIFEEEFYSELKKVVVNRYDADLFSLASLKLNQLAGDALAGRIDHVYEEDNRIVFAELNNDAHVENNCGGGLFYIKGISEVKEIIPFVNPKVQTLSWFGLNETEIESLLNLSSGKGIDRLVPVGNALDFHYIWDGYNLFDELSRKRYTS
jgi:hypothetical protein